MARMIFISPYLKGGKDTAKLSHRTNYIATREGVEKLTADQSMLEPTQKQEQFIRRLLRSFPDAKELSEYSDYLDVPNRKTASDFIEQVWEDYIEAQDRRENFLDYVARRPGVRSDGDHGLWDANGKVPVLSRAVEEVANHNGNVWTPIVSLRREDAERLGYTDAESWRTLVCSCLPEIAAAYKIHPSHLRWYAALHEKEKHFHIHMVIFSTDPREGYLTKQGIRDIKSAFATQIFQQDLICTYQRKTEYRNELQRSAEERMEELIREMRTGTMENERIEELTADLAERLARSKGKKQYGYLSPANKNIVDVIVDELAKDKRVAAAYDLWQEMQDEVCRTYSDNLPERLPLSQQKEFKPVRNMVVREAARLADMTFLLDSPRLADEPEGADEPSLAWEAIMLSGKKKRDIYEQAARYREAKKALSKEQPGSPLVADAVSELETLWDEGYILAAYQRGKAYRDGLGVEIDKEKAAVWFRRAADADMDCAEHALGKLLLERGEVNEGMEYLSRAAEHGNQHAQYRLGKIYLEGTVVQKDVGAALSYLTDAANQGNQWAQYALGKLYLLGQGVPKNMEQAVAYFEKAAAQGHSHAQYFLNHQHDPPALHVGASILRMLHHMGNIFQQRATDDSTCQGMQIDKKRRQEMMDKRIAMGHKPDDHEEPQRTGPTMQSMW